MTCAPRKRVARCVLFVFFSSRRRHTRCSRDWSSDVCSSDLIIMGDADDSYDFGEVPRIVAKLREGYALVQGCRLESGGGTVLPGAMPSLHRWLVNPMFSRLARWWFKAPIHDIYCGLRGFTRELYDRLDQRCTGMEFA